MDKLEQYMTPATEGVSADDRELGELSQKFYQAAVQVCLYVFVCVRDCKKERFTKSISNKLKSLSLLRGENTKCPSNISCYYLLSFTVYRTFSFVIFIDHFVILEVE